MRIGVLSDIHGNLHALDAALRDVHAVSVDRLVCLGDLVGYGAFPNEVIDRIRDAGIPTIMGNYDDGVGFDRDDCGCAYRDPTDRELGQQSLAWTRAETTPDRKAYLQTLPFELRVDVDGTRVLFVHGSPRRLNEYLFEDRPLASFERLAAASDADLILFGHTHIPYTKPAGGVLFVNVGSVGRPKDGDRRACYAIIDVPAREVTIRRAEYDVAAATAAIRATPLPDKFARDLETAGAPERAITP